MKTIATIFLAVSLAWVSYLFGQWTMERELEYADASAAEAWMMVQELRATLAAHGLLSQN